MRESEIARRNLAGLFVGGPNQSMVSPCDKSVGQARRGGNHVRRLHILSQACVLDVVARAITNEENLPYRSQRKSPGA